MSFRVIIQVQTEHLSKAIEEFTPALVKFGEIHKIPFEGTYLLDMQAKLSHLATTASMRLTDRGVAHNICGIQYKRSVRFNHVGQILDKYTLDPSELAVTTRAMLASRLWPDGCTLETADLRSICIGQRFEWEDQSKNGRRFAVLNLLE